MTDAKASRTLERPDAFSLTLNFLPALHILCGGALALGLFVSPAAGAAFFVSWLYLAPPFFARLLIALFGKPEGRLTQDMRAYRVWWALTQLQIVFNRLPWLEELLRLVPGLYAGWIALWGGRLSQFAYVGPGVLITDRYAVNVERGAVLGLRSILAGHLATRDDSGRFVVVVAAPIVESEAILGGLAALGPGAILRRGCELPVGRHIGPMAEWPRRKEAVA